MASVRGYVTVEGFLAPPRFQLILSGTTAGDAQPGRFSLQTTSGNDGEYFFEKVPPRASTLVVRGLGQIEYDLASRRIDLAAGAAHQEDILLRLGRVRGTLVAKSPETLRDAWVRVMKSSHARELDRHPQRSRERLRERGSDRGRIEMENSGKFLSDWLPSGEWRLIAESDDGAMAERVFQIDLGEVDLGEIPLESQAGHSKQ